MTEEDMSAMLQRFGPTTTAVVVDEGVVYRTEQGARDFAEQHDKDAIQIGHGWLAKNRATFSGPMPTRDGDVVVLHLFQVYRVWVVMTDGGQVPDENVAPLERHSRAEAEAAALEMAAVTNGRIFRLQHDNEWTELPR